MMIHTNRKEVHRSNHFKKKFYHLCTWAARMNWIYPYYISSSTRGRFGSRGYHPKALRCRTPVSNYHWDRRFGSYFQPNIARRAKKLNQAL